MPVACFNNNQFTGKSLGNLGLSIKLIGSIETIIEFALKDKCNTVPLFMPLE